MLRWNLHLCWWYNDRVQLQLSFNFLFELPQIADTALSLSLFTCLCRVLWLCLLQGCRGEAPHWRPSVPGRPPLAPSPSSRALSKHLRSPSAGAAWAGTSKECWHRNRFVSRGDCKQQRNAALVWSGCSSTLAAVGRPSGRRGCWTEPRSWRTRWLWSKTQAAYGTFWILSAIKTNFAI